MKLTVLGATGLVGSKVNELLTAKAHEVVAASRSTGVDVLTGQRLADALDGADVLIDVTNPPSVEDGPVLEFFTAAANLTAAAKAAGVGHYVALSIVGVDRLPESGYMRAKVAQEHAITASGLPYSIVRATQFEEFTTFIIVSMLDGETIRVPDALIQPISADHVAAEVVRVALGTPLNRFEDIGGPAKLSFTELARRVRGIGATIVVDPAATYFGTTLTTTSLVVTD